MTLSASTSSWQPPGRLPRASPSNVTWWLWRDRLLRSALLLGGVLISYQLGGTLAHPLWIGPVTDWLRAALAWPELAGGGGGRWWVHPPGPARGRPWGGGGRALLFAHGGR